MGKVLVRKLCAICDGSFDACIEEIFGDHSSLVIVDEYMVKNDSIALTYDSSICFRAPVPHFRKKYAYLGDCICDLQLASAHNDSNCRCNDDFDYSCNYYERKDITTKSHSIFPIYLNYK